MNKHKKLPISIPEIAFNPTDAFTIGVLSEIGETMYLTQCFNNISCTVMGNKEPALSCWLNEANPLICSKSVPRKIMAQLFGDIIKFIKTSIDNDMYVQVVLDVHKIPIYEMPDLYLHPVIIHGYDEAKQEFFCTDHVKRVFQIYTLAYEQLQTAYKSSSDFVKKYDNDDYPYEYMRDNILFKVSHNYKQSFNYGEFLTSLYYFLDGKSAHGSRVDTKDGNLTKNDLVCKRREVFGVNVFYMIEGYIDYRIRHKVKGFEINNSAFLHHYSKLMCLKIDYFKNSIRNKENQDILEELAYMTNNMRKNSELIVSLSMKYDITNNVDNLRKCKILMREFIENSILVCQKLIEIIEPVNQVEELSTTISIKERFL